MEKDAIKTIIKQICAEKGLTEAEVIETINSAVAAAFRKDFGDKTQNVQAEYDLSTGKTKIYDVKEVVEDLSEEELAEIERLKEEREKIKEMLAKGEITTEELKKQREEQRAQEEEKNSATDVEGKSEEEEEKRKFNPRTEIQLSDAQAIKKSYKIGDFVKTELEQPGSFGRMAAQTAKQVIIQRLKEAERNVIYQEFKEHEGEILTGMVQKVEGPNVIIEIDRASALLPPAEQIRRERHKVGDRIKVYLISVSLTTRGAELIVSRAHPEIVKQLFALEIPEIANGVITIKGISREAGGRTKIAVHTDDNSIDPIGSCIGQRGSRIQTIINELNGEKIDIIEYSDEPVKYIANSLLPAKITSVELNEEEKTATVSVPEDQLSLTIGRAGQNVRLASKLTGWKINIKNKDTGKEVSEEALTEDGQEIKKSTLREPQGQESNETEAQSEETIETVENEKKDKEKPKKKATKKAAKTKK